MEKKIEPKKADNILVTSNNEILLNNIIEPINTSESFSCISYKNHHELNKFNFNTMDSKDYSIKRDELLNIMDDVLQIEGISEERVSNFKRIRKKCLENQFNITFIGEFQGGKTTTFNAFSGGREISPRGAMIKTSACRITATNISENDKKECAYVQWKTDSELLMNIKSILNKHIAPDQTDYNTESKELYEVYKYLKLNNPHHVKLIKKAIDEEWKEINASPENHIDEAEICRIADIILHFYNSPKVKEYIGRNQEKTPFTIEDVSRLAVFPEYWEQKWNEGIGAKAFNPNEILFAFVSGIDCYVHSKNLERLGCSITDCPGLFTSAWDTQVAFDTLPKADAIIYLLSGEKQLSDGDKKALSYIKKIGSIDNKMFFAINTRKGATITENIYSTDSNIISKLGYKNVSIKKINAQLFFLGEFGQAYLEKRLGEFSIQRFKIIASKFDLEEENLDQLWVSSVEEVQNATKRKELKEIQDLSQNSVNTTLSISGSQDMFNDIEKFVVEKKAYSILVESGANEVKRSLKEIENELTNKEKDALKDVATCEAEYAAARHAFNDFETNVTEILNQAFPKSVVETIVSKAYDKIIRNDRIITNIALDTSVQLIPVLGVKCKGKAMLLKMLELGAKMGIENFDAKQKEQLRDLQKIIEPVIIDVVKSEIGTSVSLWVRDVFDGQDQDYKEEIIPKLEDLSKAIKNKWNNCIKENSSIEAYELTIPPEAMSEVNLPISMISIDTGSITTQAVDVAIENIIKDLIKALITAVVSAVVGIVVDFWLFGGLGHLLGILYAALTAFWGYVIGKEKGERPTVTNSSELKKNEKKIYDSLYPILSSSFNKEDKMKEIKKSLKVVPDKIIELYKNYYNSQLELQRILLNKDIEERRTNKQESLDKQQSIAQKAKEKREHEISPALKRLSIFINSCTK